MTNAREAQATILSSVQTVGSVTLSLDRSIHRVLALDVVAGENIPAFDNSAMDGYAVRSEDIKTVPAVLKLTGEIAAGSVAQGALGAKEAMKIMTGAKIPAGCDVVIQQEWTETADDQHVRITTSAAAGHNIRPTGGDLHKGEIALPKHRQLRAQEIGVLASLGIGYVEVFRPLSVAILATGNEIVEVGAKLPEGKVRNSNAHTLSALVLEAGCEPHMLGIAQDNASDLKQKIMQGLLSDALITTGGVSVGKYDLVIDCMKELGVEVKFWKVNIKPGMPMMFGMYNGKPVFSLPGNPVSSMVTFLQFVAPALRKMMGLAEPSGGTRLPARIEHEVTKTDGKRHFVRGIFRQQNGSLTVRTTGSQISNVMSSLAKANCLIILPEEARKLSAGDLVEVELL